MSEYLVKYVVRGRLIGIGQMPSFPHMGLQGNIPMPLVYVCPKCGDAWAKRTVLGGGEFRAASDTPCDQCSPGFLFRPFEAAAYIQHAPIDVVKRELSLITLLPTPFEYSDQIRPFTTRCGNFR